MRLRNWMLLGSALLLGSCVLESTDERPGGPGDPCFDGSDCRSGTACFAVTNDPESGRCIEPPTACEGRVSCDCVDELREQCEHGLTCVGLFNEYTIACNHGGELRQFGETCSLPRPCEPGLLCLIPNEGVAGSCQEQPECDTLDCDCLQEFGETACPDQGLSCSILGRAATLECH